MLLAIWPSNTSRDALLCDTAEVRDNMAWLTLATCGLALSAIGVLPLLPSQKPHVRRLLSLAPAPEYVGSLMIGFLVFLMVFGTVFDVLPILESTRCLVIAGGSGCGTDTTASLPSCAEASGNSTGWSC